MFKQSSCFLWSWKSVCLCLCKNIKISNNSESDKCNFLCETSFYNGECGGLIYFNLYELMDIKLPEAYFAGFCLTCRQGDSKNIALFSINCNANATGSCIQRNGEFSLRPLLSKFDLYWRYYKIHSKYIIRDTIHICQLTKTIIWTGLRKHKISNSNFDKDSCYIIKMHNGTVNYDERNCTEHHSFLCKLEIDQKYFPSIQYITSTENRAKPPLNLEISKTTKTAFSYMRGDIGNYVNGTINAPSFKSNVNEATIAGACITGIVALNFGFFLVDCLLKRRRLHCFRAKQQQANRHNKSNNAYYDYLVVRNMTTAIHLPLLD